MPVLRRSAAIFVLVVMAIIPSLPAMAQIFNPTSFTLANGLKVVVIENHRVPIVTHMVWYRVGSADEPAGKGGIAHLLEHLMFKGTPDVPPGEFSKIIARQGGRDNAFTSSDYTAYFQNLAKDKLDLAMKMEADRMVNLRLDEKNVLTERDVVLEERRSRTENEPAGLLAEQMDALLYINHPYRNPVIGWSSELSRLTQEDAISFYRRFYAPNNAILVVAGDVTPDEVKSLAERYYGPLPAAHDLGPRIRPQEPQPVAARRVTLKDQRVGQERWRRSYLAPSYQRGQSIHAYPLQLLAQILGGGSTSRLYRALVVERQVAAGVAAWYDPSAVDLTSFSIAATPRPGISMDKLEAAIDEEIKRFLAQGLSEDDLKRARDLLIAETIYARDSLYMATRIVGEALATGQSVEDLEAWPQRIAAVTGEQVMAAAKAVLEERNSVTGILSKP